VDFERAREELADLEAALSELERRQ